MTEDYLMAQISKYSDGKAWKITVLFMHEEIPHIKG